tara:strand:+ start:307 stop:525 length:219 start_codon:yes stop_codon:yes gene_type:complete
MTLGAMDDRASGRSPPPPNHGRLLRAVPILTARERRTRFLLLMLAQTSPESPAFETLRQQLREVEQANPELP